MALGLSPGMVSNALSAYQARIAQSQAQKQNIASGISQFGRSIAGGINNAADREAAQKALELQNAQRELEMGARERMQAQAQEFQAQQAREEANRARIDQMLEQARADSQRRKTIEAYQAAGVKLPGEASGMSASAIGPLAGTVMAQEERKRNEGQFGSLVAPVPRMPIMNPLGMPGVPESIGGGPATPQSVAYRAGQMPGGVNPEMAKRAMEFAQSQQGKTTKVDPYSPEVFERRKELERQKAEAAAALAQTGIAGRAELQKDQQGFQREMQEDDQAFRREIETARIAANPEQQRIALDALRLRKQGLPALIKQASQDAQYGRDEEARKIAKEKLDRYEKQLAEIDTQLGSQSIPTPGGAPTQSGGDPSPAELAEMDAAGMRWDPATRTVVPK